MFCLALHPGSAVRSTTLGLFMLWTGASAVDLSAQDPDPPRPSIEDDRGAEYMTTAQTAKWWAARGAPIGSAVVGLLAAAAAPALCESSPCVSSSEAFTNGAMGGAAVGALVGAFIGTVIGGGGERHAPPMPGTHRVRWSVIAGLPSPTEAAGYSSCELPQSVMSLAGRLGRPIGGRMDGFLEVSNTRFEDSGCEGPGYAVDGVNSDETGRSTALQLGVSRELVGGRRLMLDLLAGLARTVRTTQRLESRQPIGPATTDSSFGLQLGAGLRGGWYPGFGGGMRMGGTLRADWISASPMGSIPMVTLGIGVWGGVADP